MRNRIAIVYNQPLKSRYDGRGEQAAVNGVLEAVAAVHNALRELGCEATGVPLSLPRQQAKKKLEELEADLVFNLFEGFPGHPETEAEIAEVLSTLGIPFTGCPAAALRLALDKARTKEILQKAGIKTPDFQLLTPRTLAEFRLDFPIIVKPALEDASHGLSEKSVVDDFASLERQASEVSRFYGGQALVEHFIGGREFNATVLGGAVLPVSEIDYALPEGTPRILNFAAKWQPDSDYFKGTKVVCPAKIGEGEREEMARTALGAFALLGGRGYARVDMRRDENEEINVIEVNPNPDISPGAGAARQAEAAGMTYPRFIESIVQLALENRENDRQDTPHAPKRQAGDNRHSGRHARV